MCFNEAVSLNTFLFSTFVLSLIIYNNAYTKYKIQEINNVWWYLFFASAFSMQLVEFFIWRNIKNPYWNVFFSNCVFLLLFSQPIFSLMILSNVKLRNILLSAYLLIGIPYVFYKFINQKFKTQISPCGHLDWNLRSSDIIFFPWIFFLLFSLFYENKWSYFFFGIVSLIAVSYKYHYDKTANSIWCWILNSVFLYLAFYLLFYLPFYKK